MGSFFRRMLIGVASVTKSTGLHTQLSSYVSPPRFLFANAGRTETSTYLTYRRILHFSASSTFFSHLFARCASAREENCTSGRVADKIMI